MGRFLVGLIGGPLLALTAVYIQLLLCDTEPPFQHTEYAPLNIKIRDAEGALARFARGLTYRTVSNINKTDHIESRDAFRGLHVQITEAFPRLHTELQLRKVLSVSATHQESASSIYFHRPPKPMKYSQVGDWSLLYKWSGRSASLKPVLCISHMDVVPATSESSWTHPPFSGARKDG